MATAPPLPVPFGLGLLSCCERQNSSRVLFRMTERQGGTAGNGGGNGGDSLFIPAPVRRLRKKRSDLSPIP
jgi:hypothetical protein